MNKTEELIQTINKFPDRKLIFLYPEEGSDHYYTLGYPSKIIVDEYWIDDDRVWLKNEDYDEYFDAFADNIFYELYPNERFANDEQSKVIDEKTKQEIENIEWKKAIVVYINH